MNNNISLTDIFKNQKIVNASIVYFVSFLVINMLIGFIKNPQNIIFIIFIGIFRILFDYFILLITFNYMARGVFLEGDVIKRGFSSETGDIFKYIEKAFLLNIKYVYLIPFCASFLLHFIAILIGSIAIYIASLFALSVASLVLLIARFITDLFLVYYAYMNFEVFNYVYKGKEITEQNILRDIKLKRNKSKNILVMAFLMICFKTILAIPFMFLPGLSTIIDILIRTLLFSTFLYLNNK